ncbi:aminotransferase class V-fold PLP-dependent enzyme [Thiorhodococcus mannitoliphagus]|uniref:cysteine desulfurase n=1 Tax=Thiorhodococcus mannitoliphagus TaxID=329406 RepID=A0A6P1DUA6_9GAMM|nr:aminotransferase class V-fold PLP-dependent enzyme [Thiorhodococcus mannitoliphagus]NEX20551.1 aminotransferase class V-fold PLP-dependent enzyme [Thiorhodococcus mannitoliphagus]
MSVEDTTKARTGRKAICGICPAGCWVEVDYDAEGRLDRLRPDRDHPLGAICTLGEHAKEIVYSEHRLKQPMRRKGPKGTLDFEPISWDAAFALMTERLTSIKAESGPEATAIYTGRGSFELAMCDLYQPKGVAVSSASSVLFPFGSPNTLGVGALCYVSMAMIAPHVTMGGMFINMFSDLENADLIVVWGANPATDCPPRDLERILAARRRGAEVVVIDPRRTRTAKLAEAEWVPIRPGTDGALALAMANVIIEEELYDETFVRDWTLGFDDFSQYVQHFRAEEAAAITGVPAETIRRLARRIAGADGASPVMYTGLEYSDSGVQAIRATMVLWALAGQLDVPGGRCFAMPNTDFPINRSGLIANPDLNKALGRDRFPVYSQYRGESHAIALPESILEGKPYRIRGLIVLGGSLITAWPQPEIWKETLGALDFLVCIDRQLTADCAYADLVLPATTGFEIDSYMHYGPIFRLRDRVIEPVGEARNDFLILAELAQRLGYGERFPQDEESIQRFALQGSGYSLEEVRDAGGWVERDTAMMEYKKWEKGLLRPDGKPGFDTPSGKLEIASSILAEHGYDALPVYTEPAEGPLARPDLAERFPLVFNSGARVTTDFRSQHRGIPGLIKKRPEPTVTINSRDAAARGIAKGDKVRIRSPRGAVEMRALVTDDMVQGAIDANMGGGTPVGPDAWRNANINVLTDISRHDPISGFPIYKTLLCEVELAAGVTDRVEIDSGERASAASQREAVTGSSSRRIDLDANATTPIAAPVRNAMRDALDGLDGNASSIHREGKAARQAIEEARRKLASLLNCTARRIHFTGGGSEANNLAIKGLAFAHPERGHIITSSIEHPSVLATCRWLEARMGRRLTSLPVDSQGLVNPDDLADALSDDTLLVSIMTANNETGSLQPIAELAAIAHGRGAFFHTDAVQALGKRPLDVEALGVDLLTLSAHKIRGPKGVGALYLGKGVELDPLIHGGHQEHGLRAGTENTVGIVGLGAAAELAASGLEHADEIRALRDRLGAGLAKVFPEARLNGHPSERLTNTLNLCVPGVRGESLVLAMDRLGVAFSSGSACRSGSPEPSHALLAMGLSPADAHCSIRLSLSPETTAADIDQAIERFGQVATGGAEGIRFVACR